MIDLYFITAGSFDNRSINVDHFQRIWHMSESGALRLTILTEKGIDPSPAISGKARVFNAPLPGTLGLLLFCLQVAFFHRKIWKGGTGPRVVLTGPTIINVFGPLLKLFWRCVWVVDVWDIPIRNVRKKNLIQKFVFRLKRILVRFSFRFANLFIMSIYPDLEFRYFKVPERKIRRFCNACVIDKDNLKPIHPAPRNGAPLEIMCMRSVYTWIMGLDILADAYVKLVAERPNCRLSIVGRIPADVEPQVERLRSVESVDFIPSMPYEELQKKMGCTHVMVIPFRKVTDLEQTYPLKTFEAMLNGATLVVPEMLGLTCIVHNGENGLVYEADSPVALAGALARLYDDDSLRIALAQKAFEDVPQYASSTKNANIIKTIEEYVLGRNGGKGGEAGDCPVATDSKSGK